MIEYKPNKDGKNVAAKYFRPRQPTVPNQSRIFRLVQLSDYDNRRMHKDNKNRLSLQILEVSNHGADQNYKMN